MQFLSKGILSLLAVLIFSTSTMVAMDIHICKGEVESVAFFGQKAECEKMDEEVEVDLPECCKKLLEQQEKENAGRTVIEKKPCCSSESASFQKDLSQDQSPVQKVQVHAPVIAAITSPFEVNLKWVFEIQPEEVSLPPPPLISVNKHARLQVFII